MNGLAGCYVSSIGKPHEYFDLTGTSGDDESIVGDECHIVSPVSGGPRHDPEFPREKLNDHANLLLLCKIHHKLIDDQQSEYTASRLAKIKTDHEKWVSEQLDSSRSRTQPLRVRRVAENTPAFLRRIRSGKELLDIATSACAFAPHYDELRNEAEEELVAGFFQDVQDWGDLGLMGGEPRMRVYPHLGFDFAIPTTSLLISAMTRGRPGCFRRSL